MVGAGDVRANGPLVLTIDLGTSATKVALWSGEGRLAIGRGHVSTRQPHPGWAEQNAESWWGSTVKACHELPADLRGAVAVVGSSSQRETFVPVRADGSPVGPAISWSDRRAVDEAAALDRSFHVLTGVVPDPGTVAAKIVWLRRHEPERMSAAGWILGPRDMVTLQLTGRAVTDPTMASRTGLLALDGGALEGAELLPEVVASTAVVGMTLPEPAAALGIPAGIPVVAGASDRACEVVGVEATHTRPMVSWGTTGSVSVPVGHVPPPVEGVVVSRGALGGYLMEAGLAAAGSGLAWLCELTGRSLEGLVEDAGDVDAGVGGLIGLPWLGGARAPWWESRAGLSFVGLTEHHGPPHLARALVEGVAFDAARCLERTAPDAVELALAGGGAAMPLWRRVLAGVTSRPVVVRRYGDAASAGAAIIAGRAIGLDLDADRLDPVEDRETPFDSDVVAYADLRMRHDMVARSTIGAIAGRGQGPMTAPPPARV